MSNKEMKVTVTVDNGQVSHPAISECRKQNGKLQFKIIEFACNCTGTKISEALNRARMVSAGWENCSCSVA